MQPVMIPSPDPSMGPGGMMNVPGLNEPQWGSNVGVVTEDPEMTRNRQFGYAVMACAVVALAVLMVRGHSTTSYVDRIWPFFDQNFDFQILYPLKMCPIFVGSVDNLMSICILAKGSILLGPQETVLRRELELT